MKIQKFQEFKQEYYSLTFYSERINTFCRVSVEATKQERSRIKNDKVLN